MASFDTFLLKRTAKRFDPFEAEFRFGNGWAHFAAGTTTELLDQVQTQARCFGNEFTVLEFDRSALPDRLCMDGRFRLVGFRPASEPFSEQEIVRRFE